MRRIAVILLAIVATALSLFTVAAAFVRVFTCEDDQITEFPAPDAATKAIIYRRNCGGVFEPPTRQVSVVSRGRLFPWRPDPVFATYGDMAVTARWDDSRHLTIFYSKLVDDDGASAQCLAASAGQVKITCKNTP